MRWSQFYCLFAVLVIAPVSVLAQPIALDSLDQWPEIVARSRTRTRASELKTSNYRKTAINSGRQYDPNSKTIITKATFKPGQLKKLEADHVVEAQTVAKTLDKHGITLTPKQRKDVKGVLNGPENLVMVDAGTNRRKGAWHRARLAGKIAKLMPSDGDYVKSGAPGAMDVSKSLDKALGKKLFTTQTKDDLKQAGIKVRSVGDRGEIVRTNLER